MVLDKKRHPSRGVNRLTKRKHSDSKVMSSDRPRRIDKCDVGHYVWAGIICRKATRHVCREAAVVEADFDVHNIDYHRRGHGGIINYSPVILQHFNIYYARKKKPT